MNIKEQIDDMGKAVIACRAGDAPALSTDIGKWKDTLEKLNAVYEAAKNQQKIDRRFVSVELEQAIAAIQEIE